MWSCLVFGTTRTFQNYCADGIQKVIKFKDTINSNSCVYSTFRVVKIDGLTSTPVEIDCRHSSAWQLSVWKSRRVYGFMNAQPVFPEVASSADPVSVSQPAEVSRNRIWTWLPKSPLWVVPCHMKLDEIKLLSPHFQGHLTRRTEHRCNRLRATTANLGNWTRRSRMTVWR